MRDGHASAPRDSVLCHAIPQPRYTFFPSLTFVYSYPFAFLFSSLFRCLVSSCAVNSRGKGGVANPSQLMGVPSAHAVGVPERRAQREATAGVCGLAGADPAEPAGIDRFAQHLLALAIRCSRAHGIRPGQPLSLDLAASWHSRVSRTCRPPFTHSHTHKHALSR